MDDRGNEYDVSLQIKTTDPQAVNEEIDRIYRDLYQGAPTDQLDQAFHDVTKLYQGDFPGYHACDTAYHDTQHVLEVTLAMARLINGYERGRVGVQPIDASLFRLGIITALFHDCGYVRELSDTEHKNGAELTLTHVSRGSHFLQHYLPKIGMSSMADLAAQLIHFTGYEVSVGNIKVSQPVHRLLGTMLGSADIIAQMADRCYLEKCRDRLYPEFVAGGIATRRAPDGEQKVLYASGLDLVMKTPDFFKVAKKRLDVDLDASHKYAHKHFGGQNVYIDEVEKNIRFAETIRTEGEESALLNRTPPNVLKDE
ncbi:MAG: hypothetical protein JWN94_1673 [Betaproteobacteria bacterium]|nr:hypothetical protein [Betaproteobacteria bacterium]